MPWTKIIFPYGKTGEDEIDVILQRYGVDGDWTVVSLIYAGAPLRQPKHGVGVAVFEKCDDRALSWIDGVHRTQTVAAFCRVDRNWYAFQSVTR